MNYGCTIKRKPCQGRHHCWEKWFPVFRRETQIHILIETMQSAIDVVEKIIFHHYPYFWFPNTYKRALIGSLWTQTLHMHSLYRKMCFKYKQVSLHKHSSTLLKVRDCLFNQFNINYIANSTGIRFPEERIRNLPPVNSQWWPAALRWPVEDPGVVGMTSVSFGADHLYVGVFLLSFIVLIW